MVAVLVGVLIGGLAIVDLSNCLVRKSNSADFMSIFIKSMHPQTSMEMDAFTWIAYAIPNHHHQVVTFIRLLTEKLPCTSQFTQTPFEIHQFQIHNRYAYI